MFMFANSGWNKLNVREKEKDGLQFILGKIIKELCQYKSCACAAKRNYFYKK